MRIAFLTSPLNPDVTVDDGLAAQALEAEGMAVEALAWGSPLPPGLAAVVVRSPWSYYRQQQAFGDWLSAAKTDGTPFWNPISLMRWNLDKRYLFDLAAQGVPIVPTLRWEGEVESVLQGILESGWLDLVVKPAISAGAYLTRRLRRQDLAACRGFITRILQQGGLLAQPFVESVATEGELSLVYFSSPEGAVLSHGVRKRPKAGDFRVQQKHGGSLEIDRGEGEWQAVAVAALQALPYPWLYARVDLVRFEGHPVLGEIEVFEPELFFRFDAAAPALFARCLKSWLER